MSAHRAGPAPHFYKAGIACQIKSNAFYRPPPCRPWPGIIACDLTRQLLPEHRNALENGDPSIKPLVLPTTTFTDRLDLTVGAITLELRRFDIHRVDAVVLRIPSLGLVLAGDTQEETLAYVAEPGRLEVRLRELARFGQWDFQWILPHHGRIEIIAAGGYSCAYHRDATVRRTAGQADGAPGISRFAAGGVCRRIAGDRRGSLFRAL